MQIARFSAGDMVKYGTIQGDSIEGLRYSPFSQLGNSLENDDTSYRLDEVKLLAPCAPSKLVCIGLNYRAHAEESSQELPKVPLIFLKPPSAIINPDDEIVLPSDGRIDEEAELSVVIGRKAKDVTEQEARDYVFGYTCFNDVSERNIQRSDGQWTRAKGFDTFAPVGPWIDTEVDGDNLEIEAIVNGQVKQSSNTNDLIFGIAKLVSFISSVMTLMPGDIIATGTPAGVSPLKHGDTVEIRLEKIGALKNYVVGKK